ncbi:unnamed protein product [Lupinus luteus]|uniref:Cyclic nucleotide-binding domain-containing protein n=1 Tax=Lupinus luteus TaxID=3873 RepID=A0AAV1YFC2_LUPLU
MKAGYIPPREDVIIQSESPDDVYIIVPGEVEIIDCVMEKDIILGTLHIDMDDNIALWDAIASKHYSIFRILYHVASLSDPHIAGDLLCTTTKRSDVTLMNEILKHELNVDSKEQRGITPIQVAMEQNHVDMVRLLAMSGANVTSIHTH